MLKNNFDFIKIKTPPWVFFTFLKMYYGTKSGKASHIDNFANLDFEKQTAQL